MTCQSLLPFQPSSVRQHRGRFFVVQKYLK